MQVKLDFSERQTAGVIRNLFAKDREAVAAIRRLNRESAERVRAVTEILCPKDSGFMSENVEISFSKDELVYEVGWRAEHFIANAPTHRFYPPYVEEGTSRTPAQPSLGPAFERERAIYPQQLREAIRAALARRRGTR